jgi:hypothetical protein
MISKDDYTPPTESLTMTPAEQAALRSYAQARAGMVRRAGIPVSQTYAQELVDDAQADTWIGDLPWDQREPLLKHLMNSIKRRTWLELRRAHLVPFVSLQEVVSLREAANDEAREPRGAPLGEQVSGQAQSRPVLLHAITATVCQELRPLIARDVEAAAVLQCWSDGFLERDEIMERVGLSKGSYECTRKRLQRLIAQCLAPELREVACDLLRSAA